MKNIAIAAIPGLDYEVGFHGSQQLDSPLDPITAAIAVGVWALLHASQAQ